MFPADSYALLNERTIFFASYCSSIEHLLRLSSLNLLERIENSMLQAFHDLIHDRFNFINLIF